MAATFVTLACCLLAFSSALTTTLGPTSSQTSNRDVPGNGTTIPSSSIPHSTPDLNPTEATIGSTEESTTTALSTLATAESTSSLHTSQSMTPSTSKTTSVPSPTMTTATAEVTTQTKLTTPAELTTTATPTPGGDTGSTSATTVDTVSSSHTVTADSSTTDGATKESRLNGTEKYITIVFSVTLGLVVVVLSVCALCKCHSRRQFAHQPLDECGDMRTFVSDDDTLVISGGLYDAHPIYDNVPTPSDNQFRLEL